MIEIDGTRVLILLFRQAGHAGRHQQEDYRQISNHGRTIARSCALLSDAFDFDFDFRNPAAGCPAWAWILKSRSESKAAGEGARPTLLILAGALPGEFFYPLAHAEHMPGQFESAASFEDGYQPVEFRPRV